MKRLALVAVAVLAFAGTLTATAAPFESNSQIDAPDRPAYACTAPAMEGFAAKVWRLPRWERGAPKKRAWRAYFDRLGCAPSKSHRRAMVKTWREARAAYTDHRRAKLRERALQRRLDALTPYGAWAIPGYIVSCESGGDFGARNPVSTAGGAYQIIDSTWLAYGGTAYADSHPAAVAPAIEQHEVAGRILADVGTSAWACA